MYRNYKYPKVNALPWMFSKSKKEVFQKYCTKAKGYFEYGCGGSTEAASKLLPHEHIHSVESDPLWISKVKDSIPSIQFTYINIGPISEYGYPATETEREVWPTYNQAWTTVQHQSDLVLIDGRFRVACLLWICLNPKTIQWILFDDFKNRKHYFCVLEFIDIFEQADDLIVCKPKENLDIEKCTLLYNKYSYNPE